MRLFYADSSALVKLVIDEPESAPLRVTLNATPAVSCELAVTELARALIRFAERDRSADSKLLASRATAVLDATALLPLNRALLAAAGNLPEPSLRSLDAIHVAAALSLDGLDGFLTYDGRQAAAARLFGLRTYSPGT